MKKTVLVTVVAAVALVAAISGTTVWSQGGARPGAGMGPPGAPGMMQATCPLTVLMPLRLGMVGRLVEPLELTDDQVAQLTSIIEKCDGATRPLMQKAAEANKALREALYAKDYSAQKVKDLAAAAQKAEGAVLTARIDQWTQVRAVLTAEQIEKMQGFMAGPAAGTRPPGPMPGPPPMPTPPPPPEQ